MRKFITSMMLIVSVALIVAACGSCSPMRAAAVPLPEAGPYRLDSGDRLRVVVFGQEDMSGEYTVDGSGFISMPLINQVQARGRTVMDLEKEIGQRLESGNLLVDPSISVQVAQFRPFFVLGEVRQPGQFPYVEGMTVLTAVAIAGGFTYRAETDYYTITRTVEGKTVEARGEKTTVVQPGDVILVNERYF